MRKTNWKNILKWLIKAALSLGALYLVFRRIDLHQLQQLNGQMPWAWLVTALVLFNLSKILSAIRLNMLFAGSSVHLEHGLNLRLYYVGMFYNLFLPGGIGGDGYKVWWLHKHHSAPVKKSLAAVFYDRINGVAALVFLAACLALMVWPAHTLLILAAALLCYPALWLFTRLFFRAYLGSFVQGNFYSLGVQVCQLVAIVCIMQYLGISDQQYMPYLLLFLVSSIAAALPLSVGGIGARELVFAYGASVLHTDPATGVLMSLLFFAITAVSSLGGIFIPLPRQASTA